MSLTIIENLGMIAFSAHEEREEILMSGAVRSKCTAIIFHNQGNVPLLLNKTVWLQPNKTYSNEQNQDTMIVEHYDVVFDNNYTPLDTDGNPIARDTRVVVTRKFLTPHFIKAFPMEPVPEWLNNTLERFQVFLKRPESINTGN